MLNNKQIIRLLNGRPCEADERKKRLISNRFAIQTAHSNGKFKVYPLNKGVTHV